MSSISFKPLLLLNFKSIKSSDFISRWISCHLHVWANALWSAGDNIDTSVGFPAGDCLSSRSCWRSTRYSSEQHVLCKDGETGSQENKHLFNFRRGRKGGRGVHTLFRQILHHTDTELDPFISHDVSSNPSGSDRSPRWSTKGALRG